MHIRPLLHLGGALGRGKEGVGKPAPSMASTWGVGLGRSSAWLQPWLRPKGALRGACGFMSRPRSFAPAPEGRLALARRMDRALSMAPPRRIVLTSSVRRGKRGIRQWPRFEPKT